MRLRPRMAMLAMFSVVCIARTALADDPGTGSGLFSGTTLFLQNAAGTATVGSLELGSAGTAAIMQSAGTLQVTGTLLLAGSNASRASYTLSGGTLLADRSLIGAAGVASFNQSGGRHRATFVYLGTLNGSSGAYQMSGSSDLFVSTYEAVGFFGGGTFAQTSGTHFAGLEMYVGANPGANGLYDLSGSAVLFNGSQIVGNFGTGQFIQRESSHNQASADFSIGSSSSGKGTYTLSDNADLTVYQSEYVGRSGLGTFVQDGGAHTVARGLYVGRNLASSGTYLLSQAASLSVSGSGEFIGYGGQGTFIQTGGTHTVASNLFIAYNSASAGSYSMNGGTLNVGSGLYVGGDNLFNGGNASFTLSNGTVNVAGSTRVWRHGQINYIGGSLAAGAVTLSGGGKILLAPGRNKVLTMNGLAIDASSKLDLADNSAILSHPAGAPTAAAVSALLRSGYNSGNWLGNGITSSSAASDLTKSLGYADVSSTDLLIQYTWAGDANLDGQVDANDLLTLSQHWNSPSAFWSDGDFNYDGTVNDADLNILQSNWPAGLLLPPSTIPEPLTILCIPAMLAWSLKRASRSNIGR